MLFCISEINYKEPDHSKMCADGRIEDLPVMHSSPFMRVVHVQFSNGAYTKQHCHTGKQILVAIEGKGFVELQECPDIEILARDRIYIPAGVWHSHGA